MSGSPLLEPLRRRSGASRSPQSPRQESPLRPRILAPLFTNVATAARGTRVLGAGSDRCSQNVDPEPSPAVDSKGISPVKLVPKNVARLAASGRDALLDMVDPKPEWTLDDLRNELEELTEKMSGSRIREDCNSQVQECSPKQRWGLKEEVADFSRNSKPFIMRLDDDDFDSSDDDGNESTSVSSENDTSENTRTTLKSSRFLAKAPPFLQDILPANTRTVEAAIFEAERLRILRVQEEMRLTRFQLESALLKETERSAEKIAQVMKEEEAKCEMTRRTDKQYQRLVAEQRDKHLTALQRDHEQRSQVEERKIKKEEEAQRREMAVREEFERQQQKAKADAEAAAAKAAEAQRVKKLEEEAAAQRERERERERKRQIEAAQKAEADRAAKEVLQKPVQGVPQLRVSNAAAEEEIGRKKISQQLEEASKTLLAANPSLKKDLKTLGYQIGKLWNQVTATEDQVRKVSMEFLRLANNPQIQAFVVETLAAKLMSQCETQVARAPSYAYVFARIVVSVSSQVPIVMDAVLAHLNSTCIFTVPKYFMYKKVDHESDKRYYKSLGFREDESGLETADDFVSRLTAYVTLYAAITQTEGNNPYGIANGWKWCARFLNTLPANRYTASSLFAYLETAGFRLHQTYPKPFMTLMNTIVKKFVPLLQKRNDPDSRSVINRLETFLGTRQYLNKPKDELTHRQTYSSMSIKEFF